MIDYRALLNNVFYSYSASSKGNNLMKLMKPAIFVCLSILLLNGCRNTAAEQSKPLIGIVQFGEEPNVEVCKKGILEALSEEGFKDGENIEIIYRNAQADFAMVHSITQDFAMKKVDILTPLSTPCLQSATQLASRNKDIKVVFTYVFDPYRVGAAKTPEDHLPNVTGVSCFPPVERILDTIRESFPERTKVGVVWNSSEANSEAVILKLRAHAAVIGLDIVEATVTGTAEVLEASRSLVNRGAQVFLGAGDNTVNLGFDGFTKVANENKIPVFTTDTELIDGSLIAVGPDFHRTGYDGGKYIARVLRGEKTSDLPIFQTKETLFIINMNTANKLGFKIPDEIIGKAGKVIGN